MLAAASAPSLGQAAQYTYTPPTMPDSTNWSAGTAGHFNAVPVSAATTEITFAPNTTTALTAGTYTSNNDIATGLGTNGGFLLNIFDLNGLGPASGTTPTVFNITGTAFEFATNGTTTPVINLNGLNGTGGLTYNVATNLDLDNNTTFTGNGTAAFNFSGILSGAGALTKSGTSTLTLTGANTYTGATTLNAGVLLLSGANGSLAASSSPITLNGGELRINNTAAAGGTNNNRIADTQALTFTPGSYLDYIGIDTAGSSSSETMGAVTLAAGTANSSGGTSQIAMNGTPTNSSTLTLASLTRSAGGAVPLVNGTGLGQNSTGNIQRVFITTAPTLVGTTAALSTGDNAAAQNTQIVPFLVGDVTAATGGVGALTNVANTFLTYNATTGLRPLNLTDEFTNNAITAGNNTYITANTTAATTASINSLVLAGAATAPVLTINTGVTLTDASGAVLFNGSTNKNFTVSGAGTLAFGGNEAIVTVDSGVTGVISTAVTGTGGLTKSGSGNLTLSGTNTLSGAVADNQGFISFTTNAAFSGSSASVLPSGRLVFQAGGGTLANVPITLVGGGNYQIQFNGTGNVNNFTLPGTITLQNGATQASLEAYDAGNNVVTLQGVISSSSAADVGGLYFRFGGSNGNQSETYLLMAQSTYNGPTLVNGADGSSGGVRLGVSNALPTTTVLSLQSPGSTNGNPDYGQLDLNNFNQTIAGLVSPITGNTAGYTGVYNSGGTSTATLTLSPAAGTSYTFAGVLGQGQYAATGKPAFSVAFNGNGTQVLSGANLYTGTTTVTSAAGTGVLELTGSSASSGFTINSGEIDADSTTTIPLGTGPVTVASGGNVTVADHAGGSILTMPNNFTLSGSGQSVSGATTSSTLAAGALAFFNSGNFALTGTVNLAANSVLYD